MFFKKSLDKEILNRLERAQRLLLTAIEEDDDTEYALRNLNKLAVYTKEYHDILAKE